MSSLVISNVPGPPRSKHLAGAKLESLYPISPLMRGGALNITVVTVDGVMNFGFAGARVALPPPQRLSAHLDEAVIELPQLITASEYRMTPVEKPGHGSADEAPRRSVAAGLYHALSALGKAPMHRATDIATTVAAPILSLGAAPTGAGNELRRRGIELSQRPEAVEQHPAFASLLDEMAPDEARIVRFLAVAGPQPAIDVRTKTLFQVGSQNLASGVNLIAHMAGCRRPECDQLYIANLDRLGLVRFSAEPVADYRRYALLEVQPRAIEAMSAAKRTISIYRSICLSVLGEEFCACCFDTDGYHGGGWDRDPRRDKIIGKGPPPGR